MTLTAMLIVLLLALAWVGLALLAAVVVINIAWLLRSHGPAARPPAQRPPARIRSRVWSRGSAARHGAV